jgi:hypothetical protein
MQKNQDFLQGVGYRKNRRDEKRPKPSRSVRIDGVHDLIDLIALVDRQVGSLTGELDNSISFLCA